MSKSRHKGDALIAIASDWAENSVGTEYAKAASKEWRSGNFKLPSLSPEAYDSASAFAPDYAVYAYLRKYKGGSYNLQQLDAKALLGFEEVEHTMSSLNLRLRTDKPWVTPGVGPIILSAARKVESILGRFDPEEFIERCEWGPGATASLSARESALDNKILEPRISVSSRCAPLWRAYLSADIHMFAARTGVVPEGPFSVLPSDYVIRDHSRLTTVDKTSTERRVIDIQPTANLFLQKGIGSMIRSRLKRYGVDLDDQSRNQWLASVAGRLQLSTIDLAKASDSVSIGLVRHLFGNYQSESLNPWLLAMDAMRTDRTLYRDKMYALNKYSAMGNGFTFELESLIFYCLIQATADYIGLTDRLVGVYGDDLIIDRVLAKPLIRVLNECGFEVNLDKSFISGRFFESCGKHYFDGRDVTPPYQKEELSDILSHIRAANRVFRSALRLGACGNLEITYRPLWQKLVSETSRVWENSSFFNRYKVDVPVIPHWLEEDVGLLWVGSFPVHNGLFRYERLLIQPYKKAADNSALYATALRRGCVCESPFYGLVSVRGVTKSVSMGVGKTTIMLPRFPDWV